jgi:hypothetical protein
MLALGRQASGCRGINVAAVHVPQVDLRKTLLLVLVRARIWVWSMVDFSARHCAGVRMGQTDLRNVASATTNPNPKRQRGAPEYIADASVCEGHLYYIFMQFPQALRGMMVFAPSK